MTMANYQRKPRKKILGKENEEIARAFVVEADENPKLTPKQEKFVMCLLEGKGVLESYKEAGYSQNYKNDIVAGVQASTLKKNPKIQQALRLGQKAALDERPVTIERHLAELTRLRELAVDSAQIAAGVQAEVSRGKVAGLYEERLRVTIGMTDEALISQLAQVLSPDMANELAKSLLPRRESLMIEAEAMEVVDVEAEFAEDGVKA